MRFSKLAQLHRTAACFPKSLGGGADSWSDSTPPGEVSLLCVKFSKPVKCRTNDLFYEIEEAFCCFQLN